MGAHTTSVAMVDNQCLVGAEAARGTRGVHGRITAAVDNDPSPESGQFALSYLMQQCHGVHHLGCISHRDFDAF